MVNTEGRGGDGGDEMLLLTLLLHDKRRQADFLSHLQHLVDVVVKMRTPNPQPLPPVVTSTGGFAWGRGVYIHTSISSI